MDNREKKSCKRIRLARGGVICFVLMISLLCFTLASCRDVVYFPVPIPGAGSNISTDDAAEYAADTLLKTPFSDILISALTGKIDADITYTDSSGISASSSLNRQTTAQNASLYVSIPDLNYLIDDTLSVMGQLAFTLTGTDSSGKFIPSSYEINNSNLVYSDNITIGIAEMTGNLQDASIGVSVNSGTVQIDSINLSINIYVATGNIYVSYQGSSSSQITIDTVIDKIAGSFSENDSAYSGGLGTEEYPYMLSSAADLNEFQLSVNSGESTDGLYYYLTNDIELSGEWTPIGKSTRDSAGNLNGNPFKGIFDGGSHVISNIRITSGSSEYGNAFFSGISGNGTVVKNLTVTGQVTPDAQEAEGALIVCFMNNGAIVENCIAGSENGNSSVTAETAGGVVARLIGNGEIRNCINYAAVTGSMTSGDKVGGIVSTSYIPNGNGLFINDCKNYGVIRGDRYTGGVVGFSVQTAISASDNYGEVYAAKNSGGVVGQLKDNSSISHSDNYGEIYIIKGVESSDDIGGVVGYSLGGNNTVSFCDNYASIEFTSNTDAPSGRVAHIGGIVGYSESQMITISDCSNHENGTITIVDNNQPGTNTSSGSGAGIIGSIGSVESGISYSARIERCFNYADLSGPAYMAGILGGGGDYVEITDSENHGNIESVRSYNGGITSLIGSGVISGCINTGNVSISSTTEGSAGGIVGSFDGSEAVQIISCTNGISGDEEKGKITTSYHAGGIAGGVLSDGSSIEDSYNFGKVSGSYMVGGIASEMRENTKISGSHNYGDVIANAIRNSGVMIGGIVGRVYFDSTGESEISNCSSSGAVILENTSEIYAGGIIGSLHNSMSISDVSCSSNISDSDSTRLGGIAGFVDALDNTQSIEFIRCEFSGSVPEGRNSIVGSISEKARSLCTFEQCTGQDPTGIV